jgi:hypothetical protein
MGNSLMVNFYHFQKTKDTQVILAYLFGANYHEAYCARFNSEFVIIQKLIRLLIDAKISVDLETMPLLSETDELLGKRNE